MKTIEQLWGAVTDATYRRDEARLALDGARALVHARENDVMDASTVLWQARAELASALYAASQQEGK